MRISDWSSDVCSSDLPGQADPDQLAQPAGGAGIKGLIGLGAHCGGGQPPHQADDADCRQPRAGHPVEDRHKHVRPPSPYGEMRGERSAAIGCHLSLLAVIFLWALDRKSTRLNSQSLMRISYAVFCLQKKKAY